MERLILWLAERRTFTVIVSGIYFAAVVLFHEEVSKVSVWLQTKLSLRFYNKIITIFGVLSVVVFSIFLFRKIKNGDRKILKIFYWFFTLLMAGISYNTLMVVNVESIHFPQYAVLALPVFALTLSFGETVLIVTLLGAIDEANQYFILHNWKYLDFNDIILNLVGAAIGVLIIFTLFDEKPAYRSCQSRKLVKSPFLILTSVFLLICTFLYFSGLLRFYPGADDSNALVVLSKIPPSGKFWISFEWGKSYHILNPVEGVSLAAMLIACYASMDYKINS